MSGTVQRDRKRGNKMMVTLTVTVKVVVMTKSQYN